MDVIAGLSRWFFLSLGIDVVTFAVRAFVRHSVSGKGNT